VRPQRDKRGRHIVSAHNLFSVVIETPRLVMRPVSRAYAAQIFAAFTPEVCRHMFPQPPSQIAETLDFINCSRTAMAAGEEFAVTVFARADGSFLGGAGLHDLSSGVPEAGIWIKLAAHGHGFGFEAVEGLISWAAQTLGAHEIRYPVMIENWPSRRIPERLGGTIVREFRKPNAAGVMRDVVEYIIPVAPRSHPDRERRGDGGALSDPTRPKTL
jgi:[ribosomal protein S5]-alanine N-acetyltransferase